MKTKTNQTHPLYISCIDDTLPGTVSLTMAPGKQCFGAFTEGRWERDVATDLDHLVAKYRTGLLVSLLPDEELRALKLSELLQEASKRMKVVRFPIRDGGVPSAVEPIQRLVTEIESAASAGVNVVVHCRGGLGRAGTIGGCYLRHRGCTVDETFAALRRRHATSCPENESQREFIKRFPVGVRA